MSMSCKEVSQVFKLRAVRPRHAYTSFRSSPDYQVSDIVSEVLAKSQVHQGSPDSHEKSGLALVPSNEVL